MSAQIRPRLQPNPTPTIDREASARTAPAGTENSLVGERSRWCPATKGNAVEAIDEIEPGTPS